MTNSALMQWVSPAETSLTSARQLEAELKLHPLVAQVLAHRGYASVDAAQGFLNDALAGLPDPFTMKGLSTAVERLARALERKEKITLWGDYDVDGVCSTALLSIFLEQLGAQVSTYIPHRLGEGYGLNRAAVERICEDGTRLLVTLDCGITSHAEVALAMSRSVDVVVVDHHAVPETMPNAVAVLNPLQPGCGYSTKHLCAAGVAFNLCMGLRKHLRERGGFGSQPEPNLRSLMDLVALATVADVVPLTGANRILVKHGLQELTKGARPGVRALKDVAGVEGQVTAGQVGFRLGPRINAAGRLDDASLGLRMLKAKSYAEALPLARALDAANAERQAIEKQMLESAIAQAQASVGRGVRGLALYDETWHPGVVGIVASRVVERFHRPTVLVGSHGGVWRGSARSIEGFHLYDALKSCSEHLAKFGGHKYAAGVSVAPEQLAAFQQAFERVAGSILTEEDLVARCKLDAWVRPGELDDEAAGALAQLAPFGAGNPEPVLATRRIRAVPRVIASKKEGQADHLKLSLESAPHLEVMGFRLAEKLPLTQGPVDLAFQIGIDEYMGSRRVLLRLKDVRASA